MSIPPTPILQFGTSRFLQAHADLFLSEALAADEALGPITVVQSSGDAARAGRLAALADPEGFVVRIDGLVAGQAVRQETCVTSIRRALSTERDWPEIARIAAEEAEIILSNTGDAGWASQPADGAADFDQAMSYPAKLTHLLRARFLAEGRPVQVMPTELVPRNGEALRALVLPLAKALDPAFADWVAREVRFVNSLVDRIVSAPLHPAGAVAEPYALWAIEDHPGLVLPCRHPCVQVVADLVPLERLKLHILNLGHTWLVDDWQARGGSERHVRDLMADAGVRMRLAAVYEAEVVPGFAVAGIDGAVEYVVTTMDRFANPFLDHRLSDIAQNHAEKVRRRIGGFLDWTAALGVTGPRPMLERAVSRAG